MKKVKCISLNEIVVSGWADSFEIGKDYFYDVIDDDTIRVYPDENSSYWCDLSCFQFHDLYVVRCISKLQKVVHNFSHNWNLNYTLGEAYFATEDINDDKILNVLSRTGTGIWFQCDKTCFKIIEPFNVKKF